MLQLNSLTESEILDVGGSTDDDESSDDDDDSVNNDNQLDTIIYDDDFSDNDDPNPTKSFKNLKSTTYSGVYQEICILNFFSLGSIYDTYYLS